MMTRPLYITLAVASALSLSAFGAGKAKVSDGAMKSQHGITPKGLPAASVTAKQADKIAGFTKLWPCQITVVEGKMVTATLSPSDGTHTLRGYGKQVVAHGADMDDTLGPAVAALIAAVKTATGTTLTPRAISFYSGDAATPYSMVCVLPDADPKKPPTQYAVADVYDPAAPVAFKAALAALVTWLATSQQ